MTALKIKYLKGAITVFALCLIGTATAAPNGNGDEKEDKKEVKAEKKAVLAPRTFELTITNPSDQDNPSEQEIMQEGVNDPACGTSNVTICSVTLDLDAANPDIEELLERIDSGDETVTVQDFLDIDNSTPRSYSHKP